MALPQGLPRTNKTLAFRNFLPSREKDAQKSAHSSPVTQRKVETSLQKDASQAAKTVTCGSPWETVWSFRGLCELFEVRISTDPRQCANVFFFIMDEILRLRSSHSLPAALESVPGAKSRALAHERRAASPK